MKIKQLEVTGFKSFVDKTAVLFPEGISAVVGPNGCGKSNIIDAMRWVMGEQSVKMLRGKAMEDIIFSGTEKRPSLNMAEVSLTLINDNGNTPEQYREFSEITVARRLFRSGESGYFINKQPCRLKDIQDLLMGSGVGARTYAIIEQGKISGLIDAGPDERRFFVEEAAGTTRYKNRRNEALRKIERTMQNLLRVNDVLTEVKRQMNSLKRQARKAERYKHYQAEVERHEVALASHHYEVIRREMQETETLVQSLRDTDLQHGSQLAKLDAALEKIKQDRAAKHQQTSEYKAATYQLQRTIDKLEGDIEYGKKDLDRLGNEAEQLKAEIQEIEEKDREVHQECRKLEESASAVQLEIETARETVRKEEPAERALKDRLEALNQTLEVKKAELMNLATRKAAFQNTLQNTSQTKASLARRLEQNAKERTHTEQERAGLERKLSKTRSALEDLQKDLEALTERIESSNEALQDKRAALAEQVREVQSLEAEKQKIRSRHAALKKMDENYEWYKGGIRSIMKDWRNRQGAPVHGLVADVIEVDPSYEEAVEVALGDTLQYVIVTDQEGGVAAIDYLRAESAGRGGFVPMKGVKPVIDIHTDRFRASLPAAHPLLSDHIKVKKGFEDLISHLVGHVVLAEDLRAALALWNKNGFSHTIVTRQGDRVCAQGVLMGGSRDKEAAGILSKKKEIRELGKELSKLEASGVEARSAQEWLEAETIELEIQVQKARQGKQTKQQEEMSLEKELYRLGEELKHCQHRIRILDLEAEQIRGEETDLAGEVTKHEGALIELLREMELAESAIADTRQETKEVSAVLESVSQTLMGLRLDLTRLQAKHDHIENTLQRMSSFQDERLRKLENLTKQRAQKEEDIVAVARRLEESRDGMARRYAELETAQKVLAGMETEYQAIETMVEENERALSDIGSAQQQVVQKIQQLELKQTERRMRCEHLENRIRETYHRDIERLDGQDDGKTLSVEEMEQALVRYREYMARIGDVNLAAIQEYEALKERHQFLTEQHDDLIKAIDDLRRVIRKINRRSLRQFMRTFKAVNEKLQEVFPLLFQGGAAKLVLTDPKRPLESGVSYFVQPPGKKLTRMSLLSGGEKALSAISLVFSLFLIKPTAFCVFDEIDAPLDDVNTHRFNDLLRQIGKDSQVIVVTHNKTTMELADALFGVTMEDKGISKLVSINLSN
jgi:chromosome segregation protein